MSAGEEDAVMLIVDDFHADTLLVKSAFYSLCICMGLILCIVLSCVFSHYCGLNRMFCTRLDTRVSYRLLRGFMPILHAYQPYGFTIDDLQKLDLKGKVSIVTGSNVGLGYACGKLLVSRGCTVIMACRSLDRGTKAAKNLNDSFRGAPSAGQAVAMQMDLSSFESIRAFVDRVKADYGAKGINNLINNAGVIFAKRGVTKEGIDYSMGTNHLGHAYLIALLLPLLNIPATHDNPSTIVVVGNAAGHTGDPVHMMKTMNLALEDKVIPEDEYTGWMAYESSKLATLYYAKKLAVVLKKEYPNILVNSLHPGYVVTEASRLIYDDWSKKYDINRLFVDNFMTKIMLNIGWHPDTAALTIVYPAFGRYIIQHRITGEYYHPIARVAYRGDKAMEDYDDKLYDATQALISKYTA